MGASGRIHAMLSGVFIIMAWVRLTPVYLPISVSCMFSALLPCYEAVHGPHLVLVPCPCISQTPERYAKQVSIACKSPRLRFSHSCREQSRTLAPFRI